MTDEELNESELGTQEYWNQRYKSDLTNFRAHGDVGDIWFGEGIMDRICHWIYKNNQISVNSKIVDLGCGNGVFLVELAKNGYKNLLGVDYSDEAILLAREIAIKENVEITYKVFDLLKEEVTEKHNLVHDKGTYDAISLSADSSAKRQVYLTKVHDMLQDGGLFAITSCNWTEEELIKYFSAKFTVLQLIPTPQFKFGGQVGNLVASIVFQKL